MKTVFEVVSQEVLPCMRALVAKKLIESGFSQKQAADRLGLSQPAISQYRKSLRGKHCILLEANLQVMQSIKEHSKLLATMNPKEKTDIMCSVCSVIRQAGLIEQLYISKTNKSKVANEAVAYAKEQEIKI